MPSALIRERIEQGFEVVVVADATAAARVPGFDGDEAAFVNDRVIAREAWSTAQAVTAIAGGPPAESPAVR